MVCCLKKTYDVNIANIFRTLLFHAATKRDTETNILTGLGDFVSIMFLCRNSQHKLRNVAEIEYTNSMQRQKWTQNLWNLEKQFPFSKG